MAMGVAILTLLAYWQVTAAAFINYDDTLYVTNNLHVQAGLSWKGLGWAFSTTHTGNWIPLTWLSHMLDCQLYGLSAAGHHATSLLIHVANAALLFFLLQKLTSTVWSSALVAAVFAVHPINVESVAWIAERKNLLCMLLWLLTIWAYVRYVCRPDWKRYLVVVIVFIMALMSKPMAVTLPFVLLLLDYWPLGRLRFQDHFAGDIKRADALKASREQCTATSAPRLLLEKLPLVLLAIGDCVVTFAAQRESGSVRAFQAFPISLRIENAVVSYIEYVFKLLWPIRLAVFYPYPKSHPPVWQLGLAAVLLLGATLVVLAPARRFKYSFTGWLWFLGALVPVIGLVQVGGQSMADRYAYIPMVGVLIVIGSCLSDLANKFRAARNLIILSTALAVVALVLVARVQVSYWADSEALFNHAQGVTKDNYIAYNNIGEALAAKGRTEDAAAWFARAVEADPTYAAAQENLGMALIQKGNLDDGIACLTGATQLDPQSYNAFNKLGATLARKGQLDQAVTTLNRALEINPTFAPALANLAIALEQQGKLDDAATTFEKAIQYAAGADMAVQFHFRLGNLLGKKGDNARASEQYRAALSLRPDFQPALDALRRVPTDKR